MYELKISDHAIIRRYQRFHSFDEQFNANILISEIENDFEKAKLFKETEDGMKKYKSEEAIYVTSTDEEIEVILTTYGLDSKYEETDFQNTLIKTKLELPENEVKLIKNTIENDDSVILKHMGHKKLMFINDKLLYVNLEYEQNKTILSILKVWTVEDLKNMDILTEIKENYFSTDFSSWQKLIHLTSLFKFIYEKEEIERAKLEPEVYTYIDVLEGLLKRFPNNFWQQDIGENHEGSKACIRYLFDEYLKWDYHDIITKFTNQTFIKYKLAGMVEIVYDRDYFAALNDAYPGKYKIWQLKKIKNNFYWNQEFNGLNHSLEAMEWLKPQLRSDRYILNEKTLLGIDWALVLKRYNLLGILSITFKYDYKEFFKTLFDVEYNDIDIIRYEQHFELSSVKDAKVIF